MKELSIEEKAAAYDAAIKKVKELAIDDYLDAIAVTDIFPELKESEDERIRKDIVFYIAAHHKDDGEKARWLAWLEKQGEQKPAWKIMKANKAPQQYIKKSALVAKIEKLKSNLIYGACASQISMETRCKEEAYNEVLSFISTLEVKEVDLKEEVERFAKECGYKSAATIDFQFGKHFFELGLNASNPLTWEDVKEICVQSVLVEMDLGGKISDERHYTEVLKRFKAHKGDKV